MKYIISEIQYSNLLESSYSPKLMRRYTMIKEWLYENLPTMDFSYYDLGEDYLIILMYVINLFLTYVREYGDLFDLFHEIPQQDIINFILDNFQDMIIDYVKGI